MSMSVIRTRTTHRDPSSVPVTLDLLLTLMDTRVLVSGSLIPCSNTDYKYYSPTGHSQCGYGGRDFGDPSLICNIKMKIITATHALLNFV